MTDLESRERLSRMLGLGSDGTEQDWAFELADPARISEFFEFYSAKARAPDDKATLMALILASLEEAFQQAGTMADEWRNIAPVIHEHIELHVATLEYWADPGESDPENMFLITPAVRELLRDAGIFPIGSSEP